MMNAKRLLVLLAALMLAACGPIMGQMMKVNEGVKEFEVRSGSLDSLRDGKNLLVFAPFAKTDQAFFICKGELEAQFAVELNKAGLFKAEEYLERNAKQVNQVRQALREKDPDALREELGLDILPDTILFGTMVARGTTVAPSRGVVMDESYRLEFFDLKSHTSTVIDVSVRDLAEQCIPEVVKEISRRLGRA